METTQLPFQISSLYGGCVKIDGIVTAGREQLTLEYRMSDNLLGAWTGGITTRAIPYVDPWAVRVRAARPESAAQDT